MPEIDDDGIFVDAPDGTLWPVFTCEYRHEGKTFSVDIPARDWDDAMARMASIRGTLEVAGQLIEVIPDGDEGGPLRSTALGWRSIGADSDAERN